MLTREAVIVNESGFHIRPAQLFTEQAAKFTSKISIAVKGTNTVADGKSILGLMTLGLAKGSEIVISAEGADEQEAIDALAELVQSGFGEA
ncbi:HPr family phosphocarrier protein [Cohnella thermotolerans]|jgi:phosphocarrier protein HPr|uniref:HPr family phosphocarrier protein n=1 Tax=Cohnella thermotolerans TaxID=329858 RepID=UPI0004286B89|nr:HPr family phosphocarrier protein [Cohnella thermotolerans]